MPINSFIAATEPLPDRWQEVLAEDICVADAKFVVNYYRFSADHRFLFGGRESYGIGFPADISTALVARMETLFPAAQGRRHLPCLGRIAGHHDEPPAACGAGRVPTSCRAQGSRATAWRCRGWRAG
jgi:hypothetical protein